MKNIISVMIISIALGYTNSFSQEVAFEVSFEPQNLFTLSTGMSLHSVRDEMMSPLIYRGTQIPIEFSYRYLGLSNRHTILLCYDDTDLNSSITNRTKELHYIKNLNLNFEYSFSTKIAALEGFSTTCFLGARLSSMLNMRNHYFMQGKSHTSAEQMNSLGIYLLTETSLQNASNNFLSVEINIPFISYALLNNRYNANVSEKFDDLNFGQNILWQVFKKGDLITFDKLFEIQADISYKIFVSNYIGFDFQYRFQYYSFEQYESLFHSKVLNNLFLVGMMVKL